MPAKARSWQDKLADAKGLPKVQKISERMSKRWGEGTVALPCPAEVDALMRLVPRGKVTTINELRVAIAQRHQATIGCPLVTGIFSWIAANAAAEAEAEGRRNTTPYWRTLKSNGQLNSKYPGGIAEQRRRLMAEGHRVVRRGKLYFVADLESALFHPKAIPGGRQ